MTRLVALALVLAAIGCDRRRDPAPTAAPVAPLPAAKDPWSTTSPAPPLPAPAPSDPFPAPMFWRAEKDGHVLYLLGTMHGGFDAEQRIPRYVWQRLAEAKRLVVETDAQSPLIVEWTLRKDGEPRLHDELGPAEWARLVRAVGADSAKLLDAQSTAMAAATVSGLGGPPMIGQPMDLRLALRAQNAGTPMVFLEPPEQQDALLRQIFDRAALAALLDHVDELGPLNHAYGDAYERGDAEAFCRIGAQLLQLQGGDAAGTARITQLLLTTRNQAWRPRLERLADDGGGFVAVGALHLACAGNVLDLLAADGYQIARVTSP